MTDEKRNWWKRAKIYELYVDAFAGTFSGLTDRLPYFTDLGVNCLHILPHFPSPMVDNGYDIVDYRNVRTELGTLDEFTLLVEEAHRRNIRVIIDFVLNHTSDQHPWFIESRSNITNPKRDFYLWRKDATGFAGATNAFPDIKAQNWMADPVTGEFYFATFYPQQPDLNWDNEQVFDEMLANMEFWAAIGVDGFRLDAAGHLIKREGTTSLGLPETHRIIKRIRHRLERSYPDVVLLAEAADDVELAKVYFGDGDECHLVYNFPLMAHLWLALCDGDRTPLDAVAARSADIPENCAWATFLRNHDEINLGTLTEAQRHRLIDFLDPKHEYLFNEREATSMRIGSVFNGDTQRIVEAFEMLYRLPGSPIMYYGDEIGMRNLPPEDPQIDSRHAVRGTFDWNTADKQSKHSDSLLSRIKRVIKSA